MSGQQSSESLWIIDQMDGGWATLSPIGASESSESLEELQLPQSLLPAHLKEGDGVKLSLSAAPELSAAHKARLSAQVEALSADDDGGDFNI